MKFPNLSIFSHVSFIKLVHFQFYYNEVFTTSRKQNVTRIPLSNVDGSDVFSAARSFASKLYLFYFTCFSEVEVMFYHLKGR